MRKTGPVLAALFAAGCASSLVKSHKEYMADYCIQKYEKDEVFEACMSDRTLALRAYAYSLKGRNRHRAVLQCLERPMCRVLFGEMDYILENRPKEEEPSTRDQGGWELK